MAHPRYWHLADLGKSANVRFAPILLQKSAAADGRSGIWLGEAGALYATPMLRNTQGPSGWRPGDERGEPSQVLGDSGQSKLVLGASRTTQSKPAELQDALEVRKPHLDLLALAPRLLKVLSANERSGLRGNVRFWRILLQKSVETCCEP
jgi:hypothetical protein